MTNILKNFTIKLPRLVGKAIKPIGKYVAKLAKPIRVRVQKAKQYYDQRKARAEAEIAKRGNKQDILSNQNGLAILAPKGTNILNHNEEALFICKEII